MSNGHRGLLERCNGMFAFCLYDMRKHILFWFVTDSGRNPSTYVHQKDSSYLPPKSVASSQEGLLLGRSTDRLNHYIRMHFSYGEEA